MIAWNDQNGEKIGLLNETRIECVKQNLKRLTISPFTKFMLLYFGFIYTTGEHLMRSMCLGR